MGSDAPASGGGAPSPGEVLEQAGALGRAMRSTGEFARLRAAEKAVMGSPDSVKIAEALGTLQQRRAAAEGAGEEFPAGEAKRLETVAAAAAADPVLRELWEAQQEFQALVDGVRKRMLEELKPQS